MLPSCDRTGYIDEGGYVIIRYLEAVMDFGGMAMLAVRVCVTAVMFVVSGVLLSDYEKRKQKTR